jgi:AraC-like DNA-binding protein
MQEAARGSDEESFAIAPVRGVPGVEIISVRNARAMRSYFLECHYLCRIRASGGEFHYRRRGRENGAGGVSLLGPGETVRTLRQGRVDYDALMIDPAALRGLSGEAPGALAEALAAQVVSRNRIFFEKLGGFLEAVAAHEGPLAQASLLGEALASLGGDEPDEAPPASPSPPLKAARDYLEAHFAQNVTLAELAAVAGWNPMYLVRSFTKVYGLPPHRYLIHLRISRARGLLAAGLPATRVAHELGFSDQSQLNRHFVRIMGVPPGRYARLVRGR